jgi:peptide chain release factor 3
MVKPDEKSFSGFIFKIHANLDPRHRDRLAFMRIVSGEFEKNHTYTHVRTGKGYKTSNPTAFMAQSRNIVDSAIPGDIIGLHDTGTFKIGDTLTEGEMIQYKGIPSFAPQIFRTVVNKDPLKDKQFKKGLEQLAEEGVVQIFTKVVTKQKLIGVVGSLQLDVIQHRLLHEYKATCIFEPVDFQTACWINAPDKEVIDKFVGENQNKIALDVRGQLIYLAPSRWMLDRTVEDYKGLKYYFTSDMK